MDQSSINSFHVVGREKSFKLCHRIIGVLLGVVQGGQVSATLRKQAVWGGQLRGVTATVFLYLETMDLYMLNVTLGSRSYSCNPFQGRGMLN